MRSIDLHCDVLFKLAEAEEPLSFLNSEELDVTLEQLKKVGARAQVFAIFVDEVVPQASRYLEALRQIEKFQNEVLAPYEEMVHITSWRQLEALEEGQIGAILSLEGCDAIGDDLHKLQSFIDAGVMLVGLTWNNENSVAYGAIEDPKLGLKPFGHKAIQLLNENNIAIDVSHLNEQSFWDVLPVAKHIFASHSNAHAVCDHPRNLKDEQMKAVVEKGGVIGVVYYPLFTKVTEGEVTLEDLVQQFVYIAKTVGSENVSVGSDFDGIEQKIMQLENVAQTPNLFKSLERAFTKVEIEGIARTNFERFVSKIEK